MNFTLHLCGVSVIVLGESFSIDRILFAIMFLAVVRQSYSSKRRSRKTVECVNFPAMLYTVVKIRRHVKVERSQKF